MQSSSSDCAWTNNQFVISSESTNFKGIEDNIENVLKKSNCTESKSDNNKGNENSISQSKIKYEKLEQNVRTQELVFCIENVHNYAKVNNFESRNDSSDSSFQDEDDEESLDVDVEEDNLERFVRYFDRRNRSKSDNSQHITMKSQPYSIQCRSPSVSNEYIDVETLPMCDESYKQIVPDHHARRPMNAFLIFCKRHRGIVKERFKTLENRAITKILGDWWASLDSSEKLSFTNLAKKNKDVFFSVNPNFRWYKLPAPKLRTLNARQSDNKRTISGDLEIETANPFSYTRLQSTKQENCFKFAGLNGLCTLVSGLSNKEPCQQILEESPERIAASLVFNKKSENGCLDGKNVSDPPLMSESSLSSNGSEEDMTKRKLSRSCKGKIYQELIKSGSIAPYFKKVKSSLLNKQQKIETSTASILNNNYLSNPRTSPSKIASNFYNRRSYSESETLNFDWTNFNLEKKIEELPTLSLDNYLNRKRDFKIKKKSNKIKRPADTSEKSSMNNNINHMKIDFLSNSSVNDRLIESDSKTQESQPVTGQIVGSKKRKARKESITRRDVSSIENEVTALFPTCDIKYSKEACYYMNANSESTKTPLPGNTSNNFLYPLENSIEMNVNNSASSANSDLLILAEAAASCTALTN